MTEKEKFEQQKSQFTKECKWCGIEFQPKRKTKEYCSDKCRAHYNVNKSQQDSSPSVSNDNSSKNEHLEPRSDAQIEGLKGVIEDHSEEINQLPVIGEVAKKLSYVETQLNRAKAQFSAIARELEGMKPLQGGAVVGATIGVITGEEGSGFWAHLFRGAISGVGGYIGQNIVNKQLEKRKLMLQSTLNQWRQQIGKLYKRKAYLERNNEKSNFEIKLPITVAKPTPVTSFEPRSIQTNSKKLMSSSELIRMSFKSLNFKERWKELIGKPAVTFHMVIHGVPGQGKSTFSLLFADYLAKNFGNVLYASSEEGHNKTMKDKCVLNRMDNPNLIIGDFRSPEEILEEVEPNQFHFIVIDSLNDLGMGIEQLKEFREVYSNSALITVSQSTKNGQIRGSQQIVHDCDVEIRVNKGIAMANKNRFGQIGYEFEIFGH